MSPRHWRTVAFLLPFASARSPSFRALEHTRGVICLPSASASCVRRRESLRSLMTVAGQASIGPRLASRRRGPHGKPSPASLRGPESGDSAAHPQSGRSCSAASLTSARSWQRAPRVATATRAFAHGPVALSDCASSSPWLPRSARSAGVRNAGERGAHRREQWPRAVVGPRNLRPPRGRRQRREAAE